MPAATSPQQKRSGSQPPHRLPNRSKVSQHPLYTSRRTITTRHSAMPSTQSKGLRTAADIPGIVQAIVNI